MAAAQECHDRDGDLEPAGRTCALETDCDDGIWHHRPGVDEICSGFDTDCNGTIDEGCERFCDVPDLFDIPRMLDFGDDYPIPDPGPYSPKAVEFVPGGFLAVSATGIEAEERLTARAFDRQGSPLSTPEILARNGEGFYSADLTRGDARHLLTWHRDLPFSSPYLEARVLDRFGAAIGPVLNISELSGSRLSRGASELVGAFNGDGFAIFWNPADAVNELLMTSIGYDGSRESVHTVLVTDDVDGLGSIMQQVRSVWAGDRYIVSLMAGEAAPLITMSVAVDGTILSGPHIQSFEGGLSEMIMAEGQPVMVLIDKEFIEIVSLVFLDRITGDLRPPGRVELGSPASLRASEPRLAFSGEMFGVTVSSRDWNGEWYDHEIWFWRVLPTGEVLDPLGVQLDEGDKLGAGVSKVGWNGTNFELAVMHKNGRLMRLEVVCACGDADGDFFDACETDCDDTNPDINGLAGEVCTGGVDDDCDFLVDCDDPDCSPGPGPGPVQDLAWSEWSLVWSPVAQAERYDLARGLLSDALRRGDFELGECAGRGLIATSWDDDGRRPPTGDALWYLVRTEAAPCARGPWSADGVARTPLVCD